MSSALPPFTQAELFAFWNALFAYPAGDTEAMLAHFYRVALPLLGADDGYYLLMVRLAEGEEAERDLCQGWRARAIVPAVPTPQRLALIRSFLAGSDKLDPVHVGQTSVNICATSGRFRVASLHGGLVDWEEFRHTEHHRLYYEARHVADRLWAVCPVNANVEICYNFDRLGPPDPARFFTTRDFGRAEILLGGLAWFHKRIVLSHGVLAGEAPPTPAEGRVLRLLLTGQSEKMIATTLGLSIRTTHNSVTALFKKFGVQSRAELMALWL